MAAATTPKSRLKKESTCTLCREFFTDPVILECGHNFCKGCILRYWEDPQVLASFCSLCQAAVQQTTLRPNQLLSNLANIARELNDQQNEAVDWGVCEIHQEPLKFFCKLDGAPICVLCEESSGHEHHPVILAKAAAEEYKTRIGTCLEILMKNKEEVLATKENVQKQGQDLIDTIERERQKTAAAFRHLREFLEEEENRLFAQIEEADKKVTQKRDEDIARLSEQLFSLEKTIQEMEEARENTPRELLKNITSLLQRYEQNKRLETQMSYHPVLKWSIWDFWDIRPILETVTKNFIDTLKSESLQQKEKVTLDPATAHPQLLISRDMKSVTVSNQEQPRPEDVWRFVHYRSVLGSNCFQSGRHCWDICVGSQEGWAVGISVKTNEDEPLGPESGVWAIGKWDGQYRVVSHPLNPPLCFSEEPKTIRVSLNCTGCQVAFFDAETAAMLYTFSIPAQPATPYYPFFWLVLNTTIKLGR